MTKVIDVAKAIHHGKYRPDIDGLRAIAVSLVVICHAFPSYLYSGFIGVDIFFVISGYLITLILFKDIHENKYSIKNFYKRRINRIFPALIVVLVFIIFLSWYTLFSLEFYNLMKHILASSLFVENFLLWSEASYFDVSSVYKPTLHLWSLAIEEQFYIFWPLILYFLFNKKLKISVVLIVIGLISFGINLYDVYHNPTTAYYSPAGRAWELLVGSALAYITYFKSFNSEKYKNIFSIVGLLAIVVSLFIIKPSSGFPGFYALLPTVGTALIIYAGPESWVNKNLLSRKVMIWCGLISYPLYLWHWPIISFTEIIFGKLNFVKAIFCIVLSYLLAHITFKYIETPFRISKKFKNKTLILSSLMIFIIIVSIAGMLFIKPRLNGIETPKHSEWDYLKTTVNNFDHKNGTGIYYIHPERNSQTIFIGDSHVAQYAEKVNDLISQNKSLTGAVFGVGGFCIPLIEANVKDIERKSCKQMTKSAHEMALTGKFKNVVIGGAWNVYLSKSSIDINDKALNNDGGLQVLIDALQNQINIYKKQGLNVILMGDNPFSSQLNPVSWRMRLDPRQKNLTKSLQLDQSQMGINDALRKLALKNNIVFIDPIKTLCPESKCILSTDNGNFVYRNSDHLNPDWTLKYANYIEDALK